MPEGVRGRIEDAVRLASEVADAAPERYRKATFREVLSWALKGDRKDPALGESGSVPEANRQPNPSTQPGQDWEQGLIDRLPSAAVAARGSRAQQSVWSVVRLLQKGEAATVEAVRSVIRTELGVTPQSSSNASHKLRSLVPQYLNRDNAEEGQGYVYRPTRLALDVFEETA